MSKLSSNIFYETQCLSESTPGISGLYFHKNWLSGSTDKRQIQLYVEKFIQYNREEFTFLGIKPFLSGFDQNVKMHFNTSSFVGAIPLRAPDSGKQIGDFVVAPRYINRDFHINYFEILDLLDQDIEPEYYHSVPLMSRNGFRPPMYFDAIKYISLFEELTRKNWQKFSRFKTHTSEPIGQIDWFEYSNSAFKIEKQLIYPVWKNVLNKQHLEFSQLKYVLDLCATYVNNAKVPPKIKLIVKDKLIFVNHVTSNIRSTPTEYIRINAKDIPIVKSSKAVANKILSYEASMCPAWRIDFNEVFERYVQYIFQKFAKRYGGSTHKNKRIYPFLGTRVPWGMKYLEPDLMLKKGNQTIFIDAKYKSNLYNKNVISQTLKDEHRHDIHQILAYMSFDGNKDKIGILCYPSNKAEVIEFAYHESINGTANKIFILGIPLDKHTINSVQQILFDLTNKL